MLCKVILTLLALRLFALTMSANRRYDMRIYEFNCKNLTSRVTLLECFSQKLNTPNYYKIQGKLMLDRDMSDNFEVRVWIYSRPWNSKTGVQFLDLRFKTCDILNNAFQNPLLKKYFEELRRTSNIPHVCPFKANFLYRMENYTINDKYAPTYAPPMNFTVGFDFYEKNQLVWTAKVIGELIAKTL